MKCLLGTSIVRQDSWTGKDSDENLTDWSGLVYTSCILVHPKSSTRYHQIAARIRTRILQGELAAGVRVGSERALGLEYQAQRTTVRQALALLENEGHLVKDRRGAFVVQASVQPANTFLVIVHSGTGSNLSALFEGFACVAEEKGFEARRVTNDPLADSAVTQVPYADSLPKEIAGVLIWPHFPIDTAQIQKIMERVPVVLADRRIIGLAADCVRFDDIAGGRIVTQHLLELGHRRIAFLTDEVFAETVQARWQGYILAHEEAGVPCDPRLSLLYQYIQPDIFGQTMRWLVSTPEARPTAVVCANDVVALGLLRFLASEGIRVPEDISVTGFGDAIPEYTAAVSLTTVYQAFYEVGSEAARLLIERSSQSEAERRVDIRDIALPVHVVPRGSTAKPSPGS